MVASPRSPILYLIGRKQIQMLGSISQDASTYTMRVRVVDVLGQFEVSMDRDADGGVLGELCELQRYCIRSSRKEQALSHSYDASCVMSTVCAVSSMLKPRPNPSCQPITFQHVHACSQYSTTLHTQACETVSVSDLMKMFAGLMSMWTRFCECSEWSPAAWVRWSEGTITHDSRHASAPHAAASSSIGPHSSTGSHMPCG